MRQSDENHAGCTKNTYKEKKTMLYSDIADEKDVLQNGGIKYMKEKRLPRNGKEGFLYGCLIFVSIGL